MKINVVIATHNRKEDLKKTINSFLEQTYHNKEIIVVDNASDDGTTEMMKSDFKQIKYLWLPDNLDTKAINIGVALSDGEIIWRTDDDSFPENNNTFEQIVDIFQNNKDIHIIATEIVEVNLGNFTYDWYPLNIDKKKVPKSGFKSNTFLGGGAAIKREIFDKIGGFWEFGYEELEFSTRAIKSGFNIRYFPNIKILHFAVQSGRNLSLRWIKTTNQLVRYYFKHFPLFKAIGRTFVHMFFDFLYAPFRKVSFSAILENLLRISATALHTYREEKEFTDKRKLKDITLGKSSLDNVFNYLKHKLKSINKKNK